MRPPKLLLKLIAYLVERKQLKAHGNAAVQQEKLLAAILKLYRNTEIGQAFQLGTIHSSLQFSQQIPTRTADDYLPWWNRARAENTPGILHPQALRYMAKSAGTTSKSKHIPCPPQQIASYQRFNNHSMFHAFRQLDNYSLLDSNILVTSAAGLETHPESGVISGYGSGIATLHAPKMARRVVRPSPEIMDIDNWDEKVRKTIEESYPLDIRVITGIPIAMIDILEHLLAYAREQGSPARTAREIWPNLSVYLYSGTPMGVYEDKIRRMLGDGVQSFEVYSATECPMAYQYRFGKPGMLLDLTTAYYEFEPVEANGSERRLRLHEVETGVPYHMVFTTPGGLFAYAPGDRIEFISTAPYVIRFAGRQKEELNLCNEQFRLDWVQPVVDAICEQFNADIRFFMVFPQVMADDSTRVGHQWAIEFKQAPQDTAQFMAALDSALQAESKMYHMFREAELLNFPTLYTLKTGCVDEFARHHLVLGVGKLPQLHNDRATPEKLLAFDYTFCKPNPL